MTQQRRLHTIKRNSRHINIEPKTQGWWSHWFPFFYFVESCKLHTVYHYSTETDSIVWTGGAVTTVNFWSGCLVSPDLSRISRYSWQMAHKWQKKWVTKSPHGASFRRQEKEMVRAWKRNNSITNCIYSKSNLTLVITMQN